MIVLFVLLSLLLLHDVYFLLSFLFLLSQLYQLARKNSQQLWIYFYSYFTFFFLCTLNIFYEVSIPLRF